jgi:dienelactone hydrolase
VRTDAKAPVADTGFDAGHIEIDAGVPDPTQPGPYAYAELDSSFTSSVDAGGAGGSVAVHVAYPTHGPTSGPYPVVLFAHGFELAPSEYYSYIQRAASFGYVGMTVDYTASLLNGDYIENTIDMLAGLDWLEATSAASGGPLSGLANTSLVGASGHSLGGKLSILEAAKDSRIKAALTLDPVDGNTNCLTPTDCPNASAVLPLPIPTGFLGETLDEVPSSSGFSQACAPANVNYTTLYPVASSPSLEVTVLGAGHVSFLDSTAIAQCGAFCSFCATPTAPQAQVLNLAQAYLVAFYERYLRNNMGYETYLTGSAANALFVATHQATITSK